MAGALLISCPLAPSPSRVLLHQGGARVAGGARVVLLQGSAVVAAAGRGRARSARNTLQATFALPGGGRGTVAASLCRPRYTYGGADQQPSDEENDDTAKLFGQSMQQFSVGVVLRDDEELLDNLAGDAKEAKALLERMLKAKPSLLPDPVHDELVLVNTAFHAVERQCDQGYVTSNSLEAAMRGLKKLAEVFAAAEALGPSPTIVFISDKDTSEQEKDAYVRKLAVAFSDLLGDVKGMYGRVALPGGGGAATASPLQPRLAGGDNQPSDEEDDTAKIFHEIMQQFDVGVVVRGDEELLNDVTAGVKQAKALLERMMKEAPSLFPVPPVYEELVLVKTAFLAVEGQCDLGYVTSNGLMAARSALKKMAEVYLGSAAVEALGPYPMIVFIWSKDASEEYKAAHLRQLATAFFDLLRDVKSVYSHLVLVG